MKGKGKEKRNGKGMKRKKGKGKGRGKREEKEKGGVFCHFLKFVTVCQKIAILRPIASPLLLPFFL